MLFSRKEKMTLLNMCSLISTKGFHAWKSKLYELLQYTSPTWVSQISLTQTPLATWKIIRMSKPLDYQEGVKHSIFNNYHQILISIQMLRQTDIG